jgi:uncharacterized protein (DUF58 family)
MITWRAALLIAVGAVLVALLPAPWLVATAVVGGVLLLSIVDIAIAGALRDLTLSRDGDRQARLGEAAFVTLTVTNRGVRRVRLELRDAWVPSAGAQSPRAHRLGLSPGEAGHVVSELRPTRRGDRRAVRVSLRSHGPLGLAYRQQTVRKADRLTPQWTLRALPPFHSRRYLPEKLARLRVIDGETVIRGRGQGTEFDTLREYVLGDDVRSIDWRASARRSDVMVRTWRPERDRRVVCVLDTGRTSAARIGDEPRLDHAIDAALLLSTVASRAGDQVDLLAVDTAVRASVESGTGRTLLPRLANAMAPLQPALVETDFGLVTGEILRRERKRALVVLFTALEPGALGDGLLPVLTQLTAKHRVLVAAVLDPAVADLTLRPADAEGIYLAAAAHRALADRDRIAAALRRGQVEVVDAPADQFASRVTDAYLNLKATGRL